MSDNDITLEQRLLEKLLAERDELDTQIAFLQRRIGQPLAAASSVTAESTSAPVQKGEFFGMSRAEAAIALLRKVKRTMSTNEIFDSLAESGLDLSGKNVLGALYTTLLRHSDLRRVAKNTWGLREWYPHLRDQPKKKNGGSTEPQADLEPTAALER
jgi:HB1, ASXL, restriction endonuclease HTH domain